MSRLLLCLLGILLVIQVRGDGYFPFPKDWPQDRLMAIVLFHTGVLAALIFSMAYFLITGRRTAPLAVPERLHPTLPVLASVGALGAIVGLHLLQADYFRYAGYRLEIPVMATFFFLALIPLAAYGAYAFRRKAHAPHRFLLSVLASALLIKMIPLALFPVTAQRSDMLPILREGALRLFHGENPYQYALLDNGVLTPNVRLPGLMMAYLPAAVSGVDLRWTTLFFEAATFLLLIRILKPHWERMDRPWDAGCALASFLLLPYWHYRHELYEAPFWFLLFLTLLALERGRLWMVALGLGTMMGTHQWGWLFAPLLLAGLSRSRGWKAAGWCAAGALACGGVLLGMGIGSHVSEFQEHVFGTYRRILQDGLYPMSMYLTPHVLALGLPGERLPLLWLLHIPVLALARRYGFRTDALCGILALSLTVQLLFNPVAWTYQYLLVVFLLILGLFFQSVGTADPAARRTG